MSSSRDQRARCEIETPFECRGCPAHLSRQGRLVVGMTRSRRLQVWCTRCDREVVTVRLAPDQAERGVVR